MHCLITNSSLNVALFIINVCHFVSISDDNKNNNNNNIMMNVQKPLTSQRLVMVMMVMSPFTAS